MQILLVFVLACLLGWLLWRGLGRTSLPRPLCFVLTVLGTALIFILLFWGSVFTSVFLFQMNNPLTQ